MENDSLELIGKLTDFVLIVRFLDAFQQGQDSVVGRVHRRRGGWGGFHSCPLDNQVVFIFFSFRPSCLNCLACTFATLLGCELGGSCWTAFLAPFSSQNDGCGILTMCHDSTIRERLRK